MSLVQPDSLATSPARGAEYQGALLPRSLTSLISRDEECLAVSALLRDPAVRLLTLTGPGGVGKTRLAVAAADDVRGNFPDGVAFINLTPITNPDLVLDTISSALGLRDMGTESLHDRLLDMLASKRMLLVLDNFEQVITAGPQVRELVGLCPGVTLLVTSRTGLRLSGEREFPVAPLSLDIPASMDATSISGAVRLFAERAQAINPEFSLTSDTLPAVAAIVRRVDGLPLAIELAAARMKALSPAGLLQRMEKRLPLLGGGARDLPLRQQTMRDTIGWSYDLLTPAEQAFFRHIAVFVGGFTLDAAEALTTRLNDDAVRDSRAHPVDALEGITSLVDHSLLRQSVGPRNALRYQMLETVREFAVEQLQAQGETELVNRQHATVFLELARSAEPHLGGPAQATWLDQLEADHDNLRAALTWTMEHDPEQAFRFSAALRSFWRIRGHLGEGATTLERVLASGQTDPEGRARALVALASIRNLQANYQAGAALAQEARAISEGRGDRRGIAEALRRLAVNHLALGTSTPSLDLQAIAHAEGLWEEELALRRALGDRHGTAWALQNLGLPFLLRGDAKAATERFLEASSIFSDLGDQYGMAFTFINLGRAAVHQGDDLQAASRFIQALDHFQELGDHWGIAHVLEDCAGLVLQAGQAERAARLLGAVDAARAVDGVQLLVMNRSRHEHVVAQARAELGEQRFDALFVLGRTMVLQDALAEVLGLFTTEPWIPDASEPAPGETLGLTPREVDVLRLLAEGLSDREIAVRLFLSPRTVGWHVTHVLEKLNTPTRTAAAAAAIRLGLL